MVVEDLCYGFNVAFVVGGGFVGLTPRPIAWCDEHVRLNFSTVTPGTTSQHKRLNLVLCPWYDFPPARYRG